MSDIEKGKIKAKRKIKALDFSGANAAVALVSKDQGGAANGMETLVIKAQNFSDEFLEKAASVRVTMEFDEFLTRFFGMYYEDAEVLARVLGFSEDESEEEEKGSTYEDYIQSRVSSFEILKAVTETDKIAESLSKLTEDEYLAMLKDQEVLEKSFSQVDKQKQENLDKSKAEKTKPRIVSKKKESSDVANTTKGDTPQHACGEKEGDNPVVKFKSKETLMNDEIKVVEQTVQTEVVEKSQFDAIQKQAQETQELLKSAMQELEVFKAEKQAMIAKARKQAVVDAVKAEDKAEVLFKSIEGLSDEQFNAVVTVVKSLVEQVEKSALFQETGTTADVQDSPATESAVARILKSQFSK